MSDYTDMYPRRRYKFIGRWGDRYYWESVERIPGDGRVELATCTVKWFWNSGGEA